MIWLCWGFLYFLFFSFFLFFYSPPGIKYVLFFVCVGGEPALGDVFFDVCVSSIGVCVLLLCRLSHLLRGGRGHDSDTTAAVDEVRKRRHSLPLLRLGFSLAKVLFLWYSVSPASVCFRLIFCLVLLFLRFLCFPY